jgi:hypothetical protein
MDDGPDMQAHLDSLTEEERAEARAFLARFDEQVARKVEQLRFELQDPSRLSEQDLEMRAQLADGRVPLLDDNGNLIFKPRSDLTLEDTRRFGAFMDADAKHRLRQILGGLGSEN